MTKTNTKLADLKRKIMEASTIENSIVLADDVAAYKAPIITNIPVINIAFSGDVKGGMRVPSIVEIAGPSKHFKTGFGLAMVSAFLTQHEDGWVVFYDSEGGAEQLFNAFNVDKTRVFYKKVGTVEKLREDVATLLDKVDEDDNVFIMIDSLGNLASKKEVNDAISQHEAADMTRAKTIKSLFRILGTGSMLKKVPAVVINHTYKEQSLYPKDIVSGGTGPTYNSNEIWILGRQQDKDGKELEGFNFVINIEKSRTIKEKSKFFVNVSLEDGIQKWSGLWELAEDVGIITSPTKGYYTIDGVNKFRRSELENDDVFWNDIFENTEFNELVKKKYKFDGKIVQYE